MDKAEAVIRKVGSQYCIFSKDGGKRLGCYPTREQALKRLRQIEFFKHQGGSLGAAIEFIVFYGHDFEPDAFAGKTVAEWVAEARKSKTDKHDAEMEKKHKMMCEKKKKDHACGAAGMVKQSVIVKKGEGCATSREEATAHAKKHGVIKTIRETGSSYRFRQRPPSDFDQSTFRTISVSKCVSYVVGKLKGAK